jgi:lysophospholipase L1-like esterase
MVSAETLDPGKGKLSKDGSVLWFDGKDLHVEGKGWPDTELPYSRFPLKAKKTVSGNDYWLSLNSAGLCVRFSTDAPTLQVRWRVTNHALAMPHMPATGVSGVDLYAKGKDGRWRFVGNGRPMAVANTAAFTAPSASAVEYMLYLPLYNGTRSIEVGIPKGCRISEPDLSAEKRPKPVVFYGTSIVQGACASRPGMASVAIAGRQLGIETINLGLNGSGRMEPEIADLLAELDPSVFVIDSLWNMSPEQVAERVAPLVAKLRAKHPVTPILLVEDATFRNESPTPKGTILRGIFEKLVAAGDRNLHYLSSKEMLGDDCEGTVDGCHPNDLGMMRQAAAYTKAIAKLLPNQAAKSSGAATLP